MPELEKLTSLKASTKATEKSFNESALALTGVAIRQQTDLTGTDNEKKKAAIEIVKREFEAFRNQFATKENP